MTNLLSLIKNPSEKVTRDQLVSFLKENNNKFVEEVFPIKPFNIFCECKADLVIEKNEMSSPVVSVI